MFFGIIKRSTIFNDENKATDLKLFISPIRQPGFNLIY